MDNAAKIARVIKLGTVIMNRRCAGFSSGQLRQALRAFGEIQHTPECTAEQKKKIDDIKLHILTQLDIRGDTFLWSREEVK